MSNLNPLTNGSYWGPKDLPPGELATQRVFLFAGFVIGMGFAIQFVIYIAVMRILWSRRKVIDTSRTLMIHSTAVCLANLLTVISVYISMEEAFIENVNFPGGVLAYVGASTGLWFRTSTVAGSITSNVLCDFILLWRCHVIWTVGNLGSKLAAKTVMILPTMMLVATIGIGIAWIIEGSTMASALNPSVLHLSVAYFSISIALNILLTAMIIFRMKMYQKNIESYLGRRQGAVYTSVSTMFVESAAVWTLVSLPLLITILLESPLTQVFAGITSPTQICCSYFIIWRIANGRAWSNEMMTSMPVSNLEFKRSTQNNSRLRGVALSRDGGADEVRLEAHQSNRVPGLVSKGTEEPTPSRPTAESKKKMPRWDDMD